MTIAIQGDQGSNHHVITKHLFPDQQYELYCAKSFRELFEAVKNGKAEVGILAIENSIAGSLLQNFDLLTEYEFPVISEGYLRIEHCLIGYKDADVKDITIVYSHEMALKQCDVFLREHTIEPREYYDTAASVPHVKELGDKHIAGIAPFIAAEIYGMHVIKRGIETNKKNYTRFIVITREDLVDSIKVKNGVKAKKTMLEFELPHEQGSLAAVLTHLAVNGGNLTKIESRPILGQAWKYRFYADFTFNGTEEEHSDLIEMIQDEVINLKVLGRFTEGEVYGDN